MAIFRPCLGHVCPIPYSKLVTAPNLSKLSHLSQRDMAMVSPILGTMAWPCLDHGRILAISRKSGIWDTPRIVKFGMDHPWAH